MYDFDKVISRENTDTVKYGLRKKLYGEEDIIPLWVADMDFATAPEVQQALLERMQHPIYGYTMQSDRFYQSIQDWLLKRHQWKVEKEDIVTAHGIVPTLSLLVKALTERGDKVMIFPPIYPPFYQAVRGNHRTLVTAPLTLQPDFSYKIDFDLVEEQLKGGVKFIIFCNPQNPSGKVWKADELKQLVELCDKYQVPVMSDEIHADLMLWGNKHTPMATVSEKAKKWVITGMSPSKTFNLAGLGIAYLIFQNEDLKGKYNHYAGSMHLNFGGTFGTEALIAAYNKGEPWLEELLTYLEGNVTFVTEYIERYIPQLKVMKPEATYLLWIDCSNLGISEDHELKKFMVQDAGLALNEGRSFGKEGSLWQRMNLACSKSILEEAMLRLRQAVKML